MSLSRWDAPISSPALSLAKELANDHRVFYIEHPFSWKDYLTERKGEQLKRRMDALLRGRNIYASGDGFPPGLRAVTPKLVYSINFLPEGTLYEVFSKRNNAILEGTLRRVIRENGVREFVFINFFDPFFLGTLPADIEPLRYVYQCMDDISQVAYTRKHGVRLEEEIIRKADITLCTSRELARKKSLLSPDVYFHPNAADVHLFQKALREDLPPPRDIPAGGKKLIGFTGSIEYRTDFALLRKVALHHHDKIIFLVGPVMGTEHMQAGLHQLPNVVFAGPRKLDELPAYLKYFDCCIIPYKKNALTASIYPLKINEYLAAGRPVVATGFSEDILSFADVAYIADSHEAFIAEIDKAISEDDATRRDSRNARAQQNSWANRVEEFWRLLDLPAIL